MTFFECLDSIHMLQRVSSSMNPTVNDEENTLFLDDSDTIKSSSFTSNRASSPLTASATVSPTRHPFFVWSDAQKLEFCLCLFMALVGWFAPKHAFVPTQEQLNSRDLPFTILQSGEVILDVNYRHTVTDPPTIGSFFLIFTAVWIPTILVTIVEFIRRKNPQPILSTLALTIGMSEAVTNTLKCWVRRPRPNFFALCGFSLETKYCTHDWNKILEAQLSFPSGHTSLSFCSMTVLVFWLWQINSGGKLFKFLSAVLPWGWAIYVGASRIVDYWHHPSDVVAGCLLGSATAILCFSVIYSNNLIGSQSSNGNTKEF
jgi:diacylglycerol diphosphate phosphatase / phosphatidate phosphatase